MMTDPISDFLTRIRNAAGARRSRVEVMNTKMNRSLAEILAKEGYIKSYKELKDAPHGSLKLYLKFEDGDLKRPLIQGLRRESRPGLRKYFSSDSLPKVVSGFGIAVISTSHGVMTDRECREKNIGGEHLCSVW